MKKKADQLKPFHFKKGQSGNPQGGRAHNPASKALRNLTIDSYREIIELVMTGNLGELRKLSESRTVPAIQVGVARAFLKALNRGDYDIIERIAQRIIGKIPEVIKVQSTNTNINATAGKIDRSILKKVFKELEEEF